MPDPRVDPYRDLVGQGTGDETPLDGMHLAVRVRQDFTIRDAGTFLAAARRAHRELHPGTTERDAAESVQSAADALFTVLEGAGTLHLTHPPGAPTASLSASSLDVDGWRAEVTVVDDDRHLHAGADCFDPGDVFSLPAQAQ
jgi:hypothetical protein